jgi:hypothetical protein
MACANRVSALLTLHEKKKFLAGGYTFFSNFDNIYYVLKSRRTVVGSVRGF